MLLQSQIAEVVDAQAEGFLKKDLGQGRELLPDLKIVNQFALIITGIRRCGKSTLLHQLLKDKFKNAFYLHFEDVRLAGFDKHDLTRLSHEIEKRKPQILFFDEIQWLENWELFVRQKLDEGYKIVLTGSNATLLSKELGTKLTGRHLSVELFPFSYTEFLSFRKLKNTDKSAEEYLMKGGFPEYLKTENGMVLNQLLEDILYRDIAIRYAVRDVKSLKQLAVYLLSNMGKPVSANKLKELFHIKSVSTLLDYFAYLEDTYIVQFLPMFSHSLKKQIRNPKKVYSIDQGLFTENSIVFSDEHGRRLENVVYMHLRRNYQELYYYQDKKECDFIAFDKGRPKEMVQACHEITPENLDRELNGLLSALEFFNVPSGKIITLKEKDSFMKNGKKMEVIPLKEFLSAE